jgi:hypothetical protein
VKSITACAFANVVTASSLTIRADRCTAMAIPASDQPNHDPFVPTHRPRGHRMPAAALINICPIRPDPPVTTIPGKIRHVGTSLLTVTPRGPAWQYAFPLWTSWQRRFQGKDGPTTRQLRVGRLIRRTMSRLLQRGGP